jgi:hypothetical protein
MNILFSRLLWKEKHPEVANTLWSPAQSYLQQDPSFHGLLSSKFDSRLGSAITAYAGVPRSIFIFAGHHEQVFVSQQDVREQSGERPLHGLLYAHHFQATDHL